jgi:hypothetical protein
MSFSIELPPRHHDEDTTVVIHLGGTGILAHIICWIAMPQAPAGKSEPGLGFVLAVQLAEAFFENPRFGPGAEELQD